MVDDQDRCEWAQVFSGKRCKMIVVVVRAANNSTQTHTHTTTCPF